MEIIHATNGINQIPKIIIKLQSKNLEKPMRPERAIMPKPRSEENKFEVLYARTTLRQK